MTDHGHNSISPRVCVILQDGERVSAIVSEEERRKIRMAASQLDLSISSWSREVLLARTDAMPRLKGDSGYRRIRIAAASENTTVSSWVREILLEAATRMLSGKSKR